MSQSLNIGCRIDIDKARILSASLHGLSRESRARILELHTRRQHSFMVSKKTAALAACCLFGLGFLISTWITALIRS